MHKGALPALIVVVAGGYWLYKSRPSSAFAASLTKALAKVQDSIAQPQNGPPDIGVDVVDVRNWSDKSTTLYQQRTQSQPPEPPKISGLDIARDYSLRDLLQLPSAVPINGNVS